MNGRNALTALAVTTLLLVPFAAWGTGSLDGTQLLGLSASSQTGRTTLSIETAGGPVNYSSYSKDRQTLVVDLYGVVEAGSILELTQVGSPEVESVRFEYTEARDGYASIARFTVRQARPARSRLELVGTALYVHIDTGAAPAPPPAVRPQPQPVVTRPQPVAAQPQAQPVTPAPAAPVTTNLSGSIITPSAAQIAPFVALAPPSPAHRLDEISTDTADGSLTVSIRGDGALAYEAFPLDKPPRLVLDFKGVSNEVPRGRIPVSSQGVRQIRVAQYQNYPEQVARVVLDMDSFEPYRLVPAPDGTLHVRFGNLDWQPNGMLPQPYPGYPSRELAQAEAMPAPVALSGEEDALGMDFEPQVFGAAQEEEGALISLDLKDADIKDILRYFSELSGLNIILDPDVQGNVTVRLIDVPWNRALDIILKAQGFDRVLEGNVLRIASTAKLESEARAAQALAEVEFENRPLVTLTKAVSYGEASDIAEVLREAALTPRGTIIVDQRTQTLVIQDVNSPDVQDRIVDLISTLDQPTPQVEIEARIVETAKNFSQNFGIQWGFNVLADQSTGSTTDLMFPNNFNLKGDRIASDEFGFDSDLPNEGWAINLPGASATGAVGLSFGNILDTFTLDMMLSALEQEGYGRILSAPKVATQNNQPAEIESGTQIPVQVIANNTITTQFVSASLRLIVTPQITADRTIVMKVTVEQNEPDFAQPVGPGGVPPITTRRADTKLLVADGGTAVIGGVFKVTEAKAQSRIPGVHKLPIIGWLFKNRSETRQNNELLIFITPKIKKFIR